MKKVLIGVVVVFVLLIGGCMALLGGVANEVDKAVTAEEENDAPKTVKQGQAFTHDYMDVPAGWAIKNDEFGSLTITGLKMTNNSEERQTPLLEFKLYKGTEVLGEISCSANEVEAGETSPFDCFTTDENVKGWTEIEVADQF